MSKGILTVCLAIMLMLGNFFEITPVLARRGADDSLERLDDRGRGRGHDDFLEGHREFRGVVEAMPEEGYVGQWLISGKTVEVTPQTEVKLRRGPINLGTWVKVHGFLQDGRYIVREIEARGRRGHR